MELDGQVLESPPERPNKIIRLSEEVSLPGDFPDYDLSRTRKAYIFNHENFDLKKWKNTDESTARPGSSKDRDDLKRALELLDFEVELFDNFTADEFRSKIKNLAEKVNHSDCSCLLVVVMSHGEDGKIYARDYPKTYNIDDIWAPFLPKSCPSLTAKPKLFFVQACRGPSVDEGVRVCPSQSIDKTPTSSYSIPTQADFLFAYSSLPGYASFRQEKDGSPFIQTLCHLLSEHGKKEDLLSILTAVLREVATTKVALVYEEKSSEESEASGDTAKILECVQMPCFTSQLIRKVTFSSKSQPKPTPDTDKFCWII